MIDIFDGSEPQEMRDENGMLWPCEPAAVHFAYAGDAEPLCWWTSSGTLTSEPSEITCGGCRDAFVALREREVLEEMRAAELRELEDVGLEP